MPYSSAPTAEKPSPRLHLGYLDGLRGLAALYIVMHHTFLEGQGDGTGLSPRLALATMWLHLGPAAVGVFIVLSGFCLMLPVARSQDRHQPGGTAQFFKRRAWRILPPYYAALALCLLLIAFVPDLGHPVPGSRWNAALPAFRADVLLSHLLLLHNLRWDWNWKIDYPMWSVSTEWEIYFLFGLVLLPLWRRFGVGSVLGTTFLLALVLDPLFPQAKFVYGFLFAMGMTGAAFCFPSASENTPWRDRLPWGLLAAGSALLFVGTLKICAASSLCQRLFLGDDLVGLGTMALLIYGVQHLSRGPAQNPLIRLLQARPTVLLGTFSYSLYLIHAPVLAVFNIERRHENWSNTQAILLNFLIGLPLCLLIAYLFHLAFEKPFLRFRAASGKTELLRTPTSVVIDAPAEGATVAGWESSPP